MAHLTRRNYSSGTEITPKPKPGRSLQEKLNTLRKVARGLSPDSRVKLMTHFLNEAVQKGEITQEQRTEYVMPFFGETGEKVTKQIDQYEDRNNFAIGGGAFVGEELPNNREGFAGIQQVKNVKKMQLAFPDANVELGDWYYDVRNPDYEGKGKGQSPRIKVGPFKDKKKAQASFDKRMAEVAKIKKSTLESGILDQTIKINNFVKNFYDENVTKFKLRDYESFKKQLLKDFKKSGIKDLGRRSTLHFDFPNVGKYASEGSRGKSGAPLTLYGVDARYASGGRRPSDAEAFFKKAFYTAQIKNNPKLQQDLKRYLDYYNIDKKYYKGTKLDRIALRNQYADVLDPKVKSDLIYLLESDSIGTGKLRGSIIRNFFPEEFDAYTNKKNRAHLRYAELMNIIENDLTEKQLKQALGGETSIKKFMQKQTKELNKIFNTKELIEAGYPELIFNADHLEGIAEIVNMDSPEEKVRALKNLMGMTSQRNSELGLGGYSTQRRSLIDKIQRGEDIKDNVQELNKITKIAYPEFKGDLYTYNPAIKNVVPTKNFRMEYEPEVAFKQYFNELATNPTGKFKGTEQLIKQAAGNPQLIKFIQDIKGGNFKNFSKVVSAYQKGKVKFGKELNYYCNLASRKKLSTSMVPGATCSAADIEKGMRADAKTPGGRERLAKVAKNFGKVFGKIVAPIDVGIEGAFALPHLLRGDAQGAIAATTAGLFGAGDTMKQVGEKFGTDSSEYALYGAENALQKKMTAIAGLDNLLMQNRQLGIIPEESGEFKKGIGRQPQEEALRKNFATSFINLSKLDKEATEEFGQYYPLTADLTQRNKAIQNVRNFSDEIQATGMFKNVRGPSDQKTIKGFLETSGGKSKFPILPRLELPAFQEQALDYTGMGYLDRYADLPINIASQVPAYEKSLLPSEEETQLRLMQNLGELKMGDVNRVLSDANRKNFSEGSDDPESKSRRKFIKQVGIGGGIIGALGTGLLKLGSVVKGTKKVEEVVQQSRAEKIFFDLVNNVKAKGTTSYIDKGVDMFEYKGVKVYDGPSDISVEFQTDRGAPAFIEYQKPEYVERAGEAKGQTEMVETTGEFMEGQQVGRYDQDGDVDLDTEFEIIDDISEVEKIAKGEK
jgi:hypothetical protein